MAARPASYAIKARIEEPEAEHHVFPAWKTMYGGRRIAEGDPIFLFDSEDGRGLVARGVVTSVEAVEPTSGLPRQTPRVAIVVRRVALAGRPLGRAELKGLTDWTDGRPGTELNFKFYRQATSKIVGLSDEAAAFLDTFF